MSLEVLLNSALEDGVQSYVDSKGAVDPNVGEIMAKAVITALQETPLRVEVFEKAEQKVLNGEFSMMDVHAVLDALIEVLQGE